MIEILFMTIFFQVVLKVVSRKIVRKYSCFNSVITCHKYGNHFLIILNNIKCQG